MVTVERGVSRRQIGKCSSNRLGDRRDERPVYCGSRAPGRSRGALNVRSGSANPALPVLKMTDPVPRIPALGLCRYLAGAWPMPEMDSPCFSAGRAGLLRPVAARKKPRAGHAGPCVTGGPRPESGTAPPCRECCRQPRCNRSRLPARPPPTHSATANTSSAGSCALFHKPPA
jgi:hypothetical protein